MIVSPNDRARLHALVDGFLDSQDYARFAATVDRVFAPLPVAAHAGHLGAV